MPERFKLKLGPYEFPAWLERVPPEGIIGTVRRTGQTLEINLFQAAEDEVAGPECPNPLEAIGAH